MALPVNFKADERLKLCAITDRNLIQGDLNGTVDALIRGGVTALILREKDLRPRQLYDLAKPLRLLCSNHGILFIVNGSVEVAKAALADGVHLGYDALPIHAARAVAGNQMLIGASIHNEDELTRTQQSRADYALAAPVFPPNSKRSPAPPLGLDGLRNLTEKATIPLVALGGVQPDNAAGCLNAGAVGVAAIGALCGAPDPRDAAVQFRHALDSVKAPPT